MKEESKKYSGKLFYKIKDNHPDIGDMDEALWKDKVFTYEDEYSFNPDFFFGEDAAEDFIRDDLITVAGGGSDNARKYIYDLRFVIKAIA